MSIFLPLRVWYEVSKNATSLDSLNANITVSLLRNVQSRYIDDPRLTSLGPHLVVYNAAIYINK